MPSSTVHQEDWHARRITSYRLLAIFSPRPRYGLAKGRCQKCPRLRDGEDVDESAERRNFRGTRATCFALDFGSHSVMGLYKLALAAVAEATLSMLARQLGNVRSHSAQSVSQHLRFHGLLRDVG
jgi:hypothetical protein